MKPLFTNEEYLAAKSQSLLPCECEHCKHSFLTQKKVITQEINHNRGRVKFCSPKCSSDHLTHTKTSILICSQCGTEVVRKSSAIKKSKTGLFFCGHSCAATYRNAHKTTGNRRSKLEQFIEISINKNYPVLHCLFNDKTTIKSELDIYIPSIKLAIELNGIFHYEPVFGDNKLEQIQKNDQNKFQQCQKLGISLCIIDTSAHKYITAKTSQKYINIVLEIIEKHMSNF